MKEFEMLDQITWKEDGGDFGLLEELRNWGTQPTEALLEAAVNHFDTVDGTRSHWALTEMALDRAKKLNETVERLINEACALKRAEAAKIAASAKIAAMQGVSQ